MQIMGMKLAAPDVNAWSSATLQGMAALLIFGYLQYKGYATQTNAYALAASCVAATLVTECGASVKEFRGKAVALALAVGAVVYLGVEALLTSSPA